MASALPSTQLTPTCAVSANLLLLLLLLHNNVLWKPTSPDPTKLPSYELKVSLREQTTGKAELYERSIRPSGPSLRKPKPTITIYSDSAGPRPRHTKWELVPAHVRSNLISSSYCCVKTLLNQFCISLLFSSNERQSVQFGFTLFGCVLAADMFQ